MNTILKRVLNFVFLFCIITLFATNKVYATNGISSNISIDNSINFIESIGIYMGDITNIETIENGYCFSVEYGDNYNDATICYGENNGNIVISITEGAKIDIIEYTCDGTILLNNVPTEYFKIQNGIDLLDSGWVYKYYSSKSQAEKIWGNWVCCSSTDEYELLTFARSISQLATPTLAAIIGSTLGLPAAQLYDTAAQLINFAMSVAGGLFDVQLFYKVDIDTTKQPFQYLSRVSSRFCALGKEITRNETWEYKVLA